MGEIPAYPWFAVDRPESVFGCRASRYLDVPKDQARAICRALPQETAMADMLFTRGHLGEEQFGMAGRSYGLPDGVTPEDVRQTTAGLLRSFAPSHEIKIATIAVALHHWFPKATSEVRHAG